MAEERIDIVITERGSRVVKRNLEDIGKTSKNSADGVQLLKRAMGALGLGLGIRELTRFLDINTRLENRLRATGLAGKELTGVYRALFNAANDTRSSLEGSVELYSRLAISSKELGVSQSQLVDFTKSLNQAILLSGAGAQEAQNGLIQLSQGMASGALRGDELRSVLEQLPTVADVIAKELGVTRGALRDMGEEGKISADIILRAFQNAKKELEDKFAVTVPTIGQAMMVLRNNTIQLFKEFEDATGTSALLSRGLLEIANNLETVAKLTLAAASGFVILGGTAKGINLLTGAVTRLTIAIAANPLGALAIALVSIVSALFLFRNQINLGVDDVTTLGDLLRALGETFKALFGGLWQLAKDTFGPLLALIGQWVSSIDFSVVGIIRGTAQAVDAFVGFWRGAIYAVIELWKGFPSALSDIVTRGLNFVLEKISNFVNAAGELLSTVTEFAGLGKIAAVDLQLTNENEGAAEKLGQGIGQAFNRGFSEINYAQTFVENLIKRAQEIGANRPGTEVGGPSSEVPEGGAVAGPQLIKDLQKLTEAYDAVYKAQREYTEGNIVLNQAQEKGLISAQRRGELQLLMVERLRDSLDPLAAVNRELDEERRLLGMTNDQREIEQQLRAIDQDLRKQGVLLGAEELKQLREKLVLTQQDARMEEARNKIRGDTVDGLRAFREELAALNQLVAAGDITKGQALNYLVQSTGDFLKGTQEAQLAYVAQYEDTYARIEALRQADVISERTASQLKARANAEQLEQQLSTAQEFFGTLGNLSRSENKKLASIGRAAAIVQATIDGVLAIQKALASAPPPVNYAMAAAVGAVTAANIAAIKSSKLQGFATGGSFMVGGQGGTDSQTVAFRASPDERVTIETPEQQKRRNGGDVNLSLTIDARDPGAEGRIRTMIEQEMVPQIIEAATGRTMATIRRPKIS